MLLPLHCSTKFELIHFVIISSDFLILFPSSSDSSAASSSATSESMTPPVIQIEILRSFTSFPHFVVIFFLQSNHRPSLSFIHATVLLVAWSKLGGLVSGLYGQRYWSFNFPFLCIYTLLSPVLLLFSVDLPFLLVIISLTRMSTVAAPLLSFIINEAFNPLCNEIFFASYSIIIIFNPFYPIFTLIFFRSGLSELIRKRKKTIHWPLLDNSGAR